MPDLCDPCPGKVNTNTSARLDPGAAGARPAAAGRSGPLAQVWHGTAGRPSLPTGHRTRPAARRARRVGRGRRRARGRGRHGGSVSAMRVVAAQIVTSLDKAANRELAVRIVKEAAGAGADLVVLPEATMCTFGDDDTDLADYAEPLYGPFVKALTKAAGETGVTVIAGIFEPAIGEDRVYNTVVAVGPAGHIGAYRKFHLYDALGWKESRRIKPGDPNTDEMVVFALGDFRVGVMNCYDLRFPEMGRALVDRRADVLVVPAHFLSGPDKAEAWQVLLQARAIENTAYVVGAGKPGPECTGHSMVVDPAGEVLAALEGDEVGAVGAELSVERLREVRADLPVLENRRFVVRARG